MSLKEPMTILRVISDEVYQDLVQRGLLNKETTKSDTTEVLPTAQEFLKAGEHLCGKPSGWITFEDKFKNFT